MPTTATAYFPFDAGAGANVTEDQWRKMGRLWLPSGPQQDLNNLRPFGDSTGMQIKVDTGSAWIRGAYGEWTTGVSVLAIAAVGGIPGGQERWDRVIVRNDFVANRLELDVLTGTPGTPPGPLPALTQSSSKWEELLGDIGPLVNTTTTITAGMSIDRRLLSGPPLPHHVEVWRSAALSIANGFVFTDLPFDTVESRRTSDYVASTGVYTCPADGRYRVASAIVFSVGTAGSAGLLVLKNGVAARRLGTGYAATNVGCMGSGEVRCVAGDTLKVQVAQSTTTNPAALGVGIDLCWAQFTWAGPL